MRLNLLAAAAFTSAALILTGCATTAAPSASSGTTQSQSAPAAAARTGSFTGLNGKKVAGTVTVTSGQLTLSGFASDEGPDLHVYLTNGTDEAAVGDGVQISAIDFSKADQTFALSGVDLTKYSNVVIHCDKAKAVFGAATLG